MLEERFIANHGIANMEWLILLDAVVVENEVVKQDLEFQLDFPLNCSLPVFLYLFLTL